MTTLDDIKELDTEDKIIMAAEKSHDVFLKIIKGEVSEPEEIRSLLCETHRLSGHLKYSLEKLSNPERKAVDHKLVNYTLVRYHIITETLINYGYYKPNMDRMDK